MPSFRVSGALIYIICFALPPPKNQHALAAALDDRDHVSIARLALNSGTGGLVLAPRDGGILLKLDSK